MEGAIMAVLAVAVAASFVMEIISDTEPIESGNVNGSIGWVGGECCSICFIGMAD